MSDIRSNDGCWTCRVRRKKCDEARPACSTCASLLLPCHGYGPKPAWMDRGVKEKEVANRLRNAVKKTLSVQRLVRQRNSSHKTPSVAHTLSSQQHETFTTDLTIAEGPVNIIPSQESQRTTATSSMFSTSNAGSPQAPLSLASFSAGLNGTTPLSAIGETVASDGGVDSIPTNAPVLPGQFGEEQASLLMHFFDHVLPLQFRFYNPSILEGGRGWFLSILTRTKPLYHVALNLAAYHQQSIRVRNSGVPCAVSLEKLQKEHIECIKELRCHLETLPLDARTNSCDVNIEIMACITLLIGLELFRGDTNDWQMHLKVASALSLHSGQPRQLKGPTTRTHIIAMGFFKGVISWYDILSCASTGLKPFADLGKANEEGICVCYRIPFEKLMGCEDWAMRLIHDIATLGERKRRSERTGSVNAWELIGQAADIQKQLEVGLQDLPRPPSEVTANQAADIAGSQNSTDSLIPKITRIFATAALIYLQVTVSGPHPELPEIRQGVSHIMVALNALPNRDLVRNLLWPVCIAGCMATMEHEWYWRYLLSDPSCNQKWSFGYPSKVLDIMEECWRLRRDQSGETIGVDWKTAMDNLDMRVLLI